MAHTCSGCLKKIPDKCFLTCTSCKNQYDLECANVSPQRFYNTITREHKQSWICQACRCKMPKKDNTNTPVRQREDENTNQTSTENKHNNITVRKPQSHSQKFTFDDSSISVDTNLLGDTIQNESYNGDLNSENVQEALIKTNLIGIEHFEKLLDKKLKENKQSLITELQFLILSEVNNAICDLKIEMLEKTNTLQSEQIKQKMDIQEMNKTINMLELNNKKLQNEIEELKKCVMQSEVSQPINNLEDHKYKEDSCKKVVLHGLIYNYWETEHELYDHVVNIFQDVVNINLVPYIEDITRIGRKGPNKPIVIELLSKRVTKFILDNHYLFKNTGLSISEFLNPESLKKRQLLRENLRRARKSGHHAIIRNNTLLVDGKECTELCMNMSNTNLGLRAQTDHVEKDPNFENNASLRSSRDVSKTIPTKTRTFFRK